MKMLKLQTWVLLALLLSALAFTLFTFSRPKTGPDPVYIPLMGMTLIAHAGGGLVQGRYSNSREAFDLSVQNGFSFVEVDLNWTANGELVLMHDWGERFYQYFSRLPSLPPSLSARWTRQVESAEEFAALQMHYGLTQMTLDDLIVWLDNNPNVKIITDVKQDNVKALNLIREKANRHKGRFVVQIYAPEEYRKMTDLGFENIIFTAYRSHLNDAELAQFASEHPLHALTVPAGRVSKPLVSALTLINTPVYTHTINSIAQAETLKKIGVAGLYTDYLLPAPH